MSADGAPASAAGFGVASMVAPLRRVAMCRPGPALFEADPKAWHYAGPLDRRQLVEQYDAFVERVVESGAEIEWIPSPSTDLADAIFTYDPSFVTAEGAVLLRPGKARRAGEVELHRRLYERLGIPILGAIEAPGTVEGGDAFWLDERTLAVGRGFRTNGEGIDQLGRILDRQGVALHVFDLPVWRGPAACLHLLSLLSPLDRDLALVYEPLLPVALYRLLRERGVTCLCAPAAEFEASGGLCLNVLATAPRAAIALEGYPETVRSMREAGCEVATFPGDALCVPCEGGPTCLTRPILRGERHPGRTVAPGA